MKQWFLGLSRRDQLALTALVVAVALWLLVRGAIMPAASMRSQMESNNQSAAALLARVDAKVTQLMSLRDTGDQGAGANLTASISRSSELAGLPVRRLQPNSRGEVQVRFEAVDYDALVRWVHGIEVSEGLMVVDASISQAGRSGAVNATLRIARAG